MGVFLHILLCCAAAIGGYHAIGWTAQPVSATADAQQGTRSVASGLMAVPVVRGGKMQGFLFLKTSLAVDETLALDDRVLSTLVADAAYHALMPEPSRTAGTGLPDIRGFDLHRLRDALSAQVDEAVHKPVVKTVLITQLDMRSDIHLRKPTLPAVIED